jgi:hypothetical protein
LKKSPKYEKYRHFWLFFTPKKLAFFVAANQVFVVVTKSTGTASTVSASAKLASLAELAAVLSANSNDAVLIYVSVAILGFVSKMVTYSSRLAAIFFRCTFEVEQKLFLISLRIF